MNQAVKSVVDKTPNGSEEYSMVQSVCSRTIDENVTNAVPGKWSEYQKLLVKVSIFRIRFCFGLCLHIIHE